MGVATFTKSGAKAATAAKLDAGVFGLKVANHQLLKDAYLSYLANGRRGAAHVKRRGEVRGGGSKPWRQKGTGRARFGSSRNPIWRGGGVALGPTGQENYRRGLSLAAKRQALRQALSLAAQGGKISVIEALAFKEAKTKQAETLFKKLGTTRNLLMVLETVSQPQRRATANLSNVKLVRTKYLNVFDLLNADHVVLEKAALKTVSEWLGGSQR